MNSVQPWIVCRTVPAEWRLSKLVLPINHSICTAFLFFVFLLFYFHFYFFHCFVALSTQNVGIIFFLLSVGNSFKIISFFMVSFNMTPASVRIYIESFRKLPFNMNKYQIHYNLHKSLILHCFSLSLCVCACIFYFHFLINLLHSENEATHLYTKAYTLTHQPKRYHLS